MLSNVPKITPLLSEWTMIWMSVAGDQNYAFNYTLYKTNLALDERKVMYLGSKKVISGLCTWGEPPGYWQMTVTRKDQIRKIRTGGVELSYFLFWFYINHIRKIYMGKIRGKVNTNKNCFKTSVINFPIICLSLSLFQGCFKVVVEAQGCLSSTQSSGWEERDQYI